MNAIDYINEKIKEYKEYRDIYGDRTQGEIDMLEKIKELINKE